MATTLKARVARWVACVVAVGAYALGVCAPTHAVGTPLPTPSVPVTTAPETPLLPNHGIVARVVVEQLLVETSEDTREWAMLSRRLLCQGQSRRRQLRHRSLLSWGGAPRVLFPR